ncbi:TrkA-N domain-containing protein [Cyclobacterium lianum]|uniref:TrkA-N domain-containing protein n=1 Tax=Cyclobacterium lianum TaxID=388280 RepID=A0A1M7N6F7_9BACT|nr:NAD-binding protein [Cyclobacterium lianum]SHM99083.1 TrkA-N domain-containing protein [Cyclobacterium lianum]
MGYRTKFIAVTGHRDLRPEDLPEIKNRVKEKLIQITQNQGAESYRLLSGMASGADLLVAEIARELGIPATAVLTSQNQAMELPAGIDKQILPVNFPPGEEEKYYEALEGYLLLKANHFLILWDGVYNGKRGGTSSVVSRALETDRELVLHHLVVPRMVNPYPLASLLAKSLVFSREKFQRIPFTVHFSWIDAKLPFKKKASLFKKFWEPFLRKAGSHVFLSFVLPMLLVLSTLTLGTIGFLQILPELDFHNALFMSVNLVTFNNSVIEVQDVPFALNLARYLGLITALSAFTIALFFALGPERRRLKLIFWQRFYPHKYILVLGSGEKSFTLVRNLCSCRNKVVVVTPEENQPFTTEIQRSGAVWIKGSPHSSSLLKKVYQHRASEIYLMDEDDTVNVRTCLELERISRKNIPKRQRWFAHLQDGLLKAFLYGNLEDASRNHLHIFDIRENTARRLQLFYPFDRFYQSPDADQAMVVVIGFEKLGREIALNALRLGHFPGNKRLKVRVFCPDAVAAKERFLRAYPIFDTHPKPAHLKALIEDLWETDTLEFFELPMDDAAMLSGRAPLFADVIQARNTVSMYVCLENDLGSSSYLSVLLPKLNRYKRQMNCNLQVFCFYKFPDKTEERNTEMRLNQLAPEVPVHCFGNLLDECTAVAIRDRALDALPKQIAFWYMQGYGDKRLDIDQVWQNSSEQEKESNRHAADHLWVKLRSVWQEIDWKFHSETFEPLLDPGTMAIHEKRLSETEHRRWCAELLLHGFRPLQDEPGVMESWSDWEDYWYRRGGKKILKAEKLHIDLRPFNTLPEMEQKKDLDQIRTIPKMLQAIIRP